MIFWDESKFNIHESDGHQKVCRKANAALEPKNTRGTVKHSGGSIMVWGCMAATGVGNLVIIDGIMNQYSYLNILNNNLSQSASKLGLNGSFTFQQDNDPKHTARLFGNGCENRCCGLMRTRPCVCPLRFQFTECPASGFKSFSWGRKTGKYDALSHS
ncbi:transposable element Tc1 transposase [Trichonephila clavipes]|nr:transposable element Tc1 transposase [Trichonephila clavipes]